MPIIEEVKSIRDLEIEGRTVFMRLDFNVPLSDEGTVEDDTRITEALPTIQHAISRGAKIVLASHLGRPDGKVNPKFSLEPVAVHLSELIKQEVTLADDCVGEGIELMAKSLKAGQILLLENLRFHREEEANDPDFCHRLARIGEFYVTDAFGTAHREHASTYGLPQIMPHKGMGFLIEKELKFLNQLLDHPPAPFYFVLGGAKVSDKIACIDSLLRRVNGLVIGGAMAYAFWTALDKELPFGAKKPSLKDVEAAVTILRDAKKRDIPVLLPEDTIEAFDIGPVTVGKFSEFLQNAKTIFWNGPMGWFEKPEYSKGTLAIAELIASLSALKVVGGGDTVLAIKQSGLAEKFDHLSTGGGAALEYLEGKGLPGIEILKSHTRTALDS